MITGLPQGYVRFGSIAHRILVALHELGDMGQTDLNEEIDESPGAIGMQLTNLRRHGFIFIVRKASRCGTGQVTQAIYSLQRPEQVPCYRKATGAERQTRYRKAKKMQVASVFELRVVF